MLLVLIFVLVGIFIYRFANPGGGQLAAPAQPAANQPEGAAPDTTAKPAAAAQAEPSGPTDEDRDEKDDMEVDQDFIKDRTLDIGKVEMVAYDRVLKWVNNQSLAVLQKRARTDIPLDRLLSDVENTRLKIVKIDLKVRHVIKCNDIKVPGGDNLYEIHGFTANSRMYFGIVEGLPEGMPVGTDVSEQAQLVGYFFKVHGYYPGAIKTAEPLRAPLIIGRLAWEPPAFARPDTTPIWVWAALAMGVIVVVGGVVGIVTILGRRRPLSVRLPTRSADPDAPAVDDWLDQAQSGNLAAGNNFAGNGESRNGNGQPRGTDADDGHPPQFLGDFDSDRTGR
jgi:hypothetical protein